MTAAAPTIQAFFLTRLGAERDASHHTIDSYRHTFRLLLAFAKAHTGKDPCELDIADLDAGLVSWLPRSPRVRTEQHRRHPQHPPGGHPLLFPLRVLSPSGACAHHRQVLAIPQKKAETVPRCYLTEAEMGALIAAPDRTTWSGRRDHALLVTALRTGMRLSELTGLRCQDVELRSPAHIKCLGKGRKRRDIPIDKATVAVLRAWLIERRGEPDDPLFVSRRRSRLSADAVQRLVAKHVGRAAATCPSLANKSVSTHNLRHSVAMDLLGHGLDVAVVALWLGHEKLESVKPYIHADPTLKQRALERLTPLNPAATSQGATGRPTTCSPSSRASDNAAFVVQVGRSISAFNRGSVGCRSSTRHYGQRGIQGPCGGGPRQ